MARHCVTVLAGETSGAFVRGHHKGDVLIIIIDGAAYFGERQDAAIAQGLEKTVRDAEEFFDLSGFEPFFSWCAGHTFFNNAFHFLDHVRFEIFQVAKGQYLVARGNHAHGL